MHNPPHPGETLRDDVLPALGLTVTAAESKLRTDPRLFLRCGICWGSQTHSTLPTGYK